jgi:hypothetical protein
VDGSGRHSVSRLASREIQSVVDMLVPQCMHTRPRLILIHEGRPTAVFLNYRAPPPQARSI